jgi:hypothetical protein
VCKRTLYVRTTSHTIILFFVVSISEIMFSVYVEARFWWESPKERDHVEDQGVGGKMGSEWILGRLAWGVWIGFDWLRTGTGGGLL